jgi:hypothetical protein
MAQTNAKAVTSTDERIEGIWSGIDPKRVRVITDILRPCFALSVRLAPPLPPGSSDRGPGVIETAKSIYHWLACEDGSFGRVILQRSVSTLRDARIKDFVWLDDILKKRYPLIGQTLPQACLEAMEPGFEHLARVLPKLFRIRLWDSYVRSVQSAAAYAKWTEFPDETDYFRHLIEVWHSGCPPVGYGKTFSGADAVVFLADDPAC